MRTTLVRLGLFLLTAAFAAQAGTVEFHNFTNLNLAIPDGSIMGTSESHAINSTIGRISELRVRLQIDGEFNGDLYGYLRQINGTVTNFCVLLNRPGKTFANPAGYADAGLDVVFDDDANGDFHLYRTLPTSVTMITELLPTGMLNSNYTATLVAGAGLPPYTWSIIGGSLPVGLLLNTNTGTIMGSPVAAGSYNFAARARDTGSPATSATRTFNITIVNPAPVTGNTNDGTLTDSIWLTGSWINASRFQAGANITIATVRAKVATITGSYKCAIYSDSNGVPSRLLRSTDPITNPSVNWNSLPLAAPVPLTNGQFYWIAIWSDSQNARVFYSGNNGTLRWGRYNYGAWPDPIAMTGSGSFNYCLYAVSAPPALTGLSLTPLAPVTPAGNSRQFTATGTYSDGSRQNLSALATWTSTQPNVAAIAGGGLVVATTPGSTTVQASFGSWSASTTLTVQTNVPGGSKVFGDWQPDARGAHPANVNEASPRTNYLKSFLGDSASGQWTLFLADADSGATHQLKRWALEITGARYPHVQCSSPVDIVYGTPLSFAQPQFNPTAEIPGTFTYDPPLGSVLNAGDGQALAVTFTPLDTTNYLTVTTNVIINVRKQELTIAATSTNKVYGSPMPALGVTYSGFVNGDSPATLDAPVNLSTSATAASSAGAYPILVSGAADANYNIQFQSGVLTVTRAPITGTLTSSANPQMPATIFTLVHRVTPVAPATNTPTGPVQFRVNGVPIGSTDLIAGEARLLFSLATGTYTIAAEYAGNANYLATTNTLLQLIGTSVPAPRLAITPLPSGAFQLSFSGLPDLVYRIEYTTNLTDWLHLTSGTPNALGVFEWVDTPGASATTRFYRAVHP